jgi:hypothetical protein
MFEKESKEYAIDAPPPFSVTREAFKQGAEFGYSKGKNEAKEIILKLYNAGRDVLMCRAEEKAFDNLSKAINDKSIEQFLEETR